ncbi:DUF4160 domain-containing protein [Pseudomonas prosekii]|uniref:DUF4160 domain-containing protein n=1 Tax=Pseudomonas prosekii TaxID=1148509 RepID=A0A3L8CM67_9PSED|nr:DUF4160 domain-containing protein [Pseudomonas prosekii]RLU08993.1 DUF4160 domain-containing protein [Pseudomonas prosekii]RLU13160.1 DUF4160 domain-containing protein [Pseudomonas prosekii]
MRLFSYKGLSMMIMLRDEHCPPHAHVDAGVWSARFKFSFCHNSVELWDVVAHSRRAPSAVLEGLRQGLSQPAHLRRARGIWWDKLQTACLDNQLWDTQHDEVVMMKSVASTTYMIGSSYYEPEKNKTLLALMGAPEGVEIEL